jgi:hypothetical protein
VISFAVCVAFVNTDDLLRAKMYAQFAAFTFFRVYDNFENRHMLSVLSVPYAAAIMSK